MCSSRNRILLLPIRGDFGNSKFIDGKYQIGQSGDCDVS